MRVIHCESVILKFRIAFQTINALLVDYEDGDIICLVCQKLRHCHLNPKLFQNLLTDIVNQIKPADDLTSLVNKMFQERDSNQNDEITKELEGITIRWNSLCQNVINKSGR